MARNSNRDIIIENARILFQNFSGAADTYNREGDRNFLLLLEDPDLVARLQKDGWNVKFLKPREEGDEPRPYLHVSVGFANMPPTVVTVTSKGKTYLDERSVSLLDHAEVDNWDVIVTPYDWEVNGKTGVKAYLKALYVVLVEDPLMLKYQDVGPQ